MQVWSCGQTPQVRSRSRSTLYGQEICACSANMRDEESGIPHPLKRGSVSSPSSAAYKNSVVCCAELLLPAITRVAGIIGGVLLSLMLSVLLWPKSASEQAMRYARTTCSPSQWLCTLGMLEWAHTTAMSFWLWISFQSQAVGAWLPSGAWVACSCWSCPPSLHGTY